MFRSMLALIPQVWLRPRAAFRALKTLPAVVGFTHLALVMAWVTWLSALGYREALGLPCWAGALFCVAASILHFPLALLFMRPI